MHLASVDGSIGPAQEATIPATDEGLLRGDGAFEVARIYAGRPFALGEHLGRLRSTCLGLRLEHDFTALEREIARAGKRILAFHVCDWLTPTRDLLNDRGMMGDGVIELRRLRTAVDDAGYTGPIEVEIFNQAIWDTPGDEVLARMSERYLAHV